MELHVIITGATGMVGEGVLRECLRNSTVASVLVIGRRSCGIRHEKLKELLHGDFFDISSLSGRLKGYNACFFCLGVSSVGMKEDAYFRFTHTLTLHVASVLSQCNPQMVFCYISGAGTRSDEQGRMWARVKGKTENDLAALPFSQVYGVRPGFIKADREGQFTSKWYKYIGWLYHPLRLLFPGAACSLPELGRAMIRVSAYGYDRRVLEVKDIVALGS